MPLISSCTFSSSFNSYFFARARSSFVPLRSRAPHMPNELLTELAKFAHYDFLEQSCSANSRLQTLFLPILSSKHQTLCSLYFADVRSLYLWLKNWTVRSDALQKFVALRAAVDSKWCGEALQTKSDIWTVNRARVTSRGLIADLRELRSLIDELSTTLNKIYEGNLNENASSASCVWLRQFHLSQAVSARFRSHRSLLIAKGLVMPKMKLDGWLCKDLPSLKPLVRGLVQLLRDHFKDESVLCRSQYTGCLNLLKKCEARLIVLTVSPQ